MYTNIFQEIVNIMHQDYAGYIDKKGWDHPRVYENRIRNLEGKGQLTANSFSEIVQDYLLDFKDPHLFFSVSEDGSQKEYDNGFQVRRFKGKLYVTSTTNDNHLKLGDAILSLDHIPIFDLLKKHQRELMETKAEREDWRNVISKYSIAEVVDVEGNIRHVTLERYEKAAYQPSHTIEHIGDDTLLMTLSDFFDSTSIEELLDRHKASLEIKPNLIIDVRTNLGGSTLSYKSLEKYLFPTGKNEIDFSFYNMKVNCTNRNADLIIKLIDEELDKIENKAHREGLIRWKEETWEKYRGKGFVSFDNKDDENIYEITGLNFPGNIIVLTDNYCGSAGDIFVYLCKQSPKITVIGRPTMGVNDYSNLTKKVWNHQFKLMYATSRLEQLDYRNPEAELGIKPDIYIPWTPQHINKDVDMEKALKILKEKVVE